MLKQDLKSIGTAITIITIILACLIILFNMTILFCLIYQGKLADHGKRYTSRRVGLLHSINTYIHIIGDTITFLSMSSRTLYADLYLNNRKELAVSWDCRLWNYLICMFGAGLCGSFFLQALFHFWRITIPKRRLFLQFSFHIQLICIHWILIIILSLPTWSRPVYIISEHYCLNRIDDNWLSMYLLFIIIIIPASGIIYIYLKIIMHMKNSRELGKRWRRMKRDALIIRRIIFVVLIVFESTGTGFIIWLVVFIQKNFPPLSYRFLCLLMEIGLLTCSIILLFVSPQLRRVLQSKYP